MKRARHCSTTGKRKFGGKTDALRAIARTRLDPNANRSPMLYLCRCGEWHLHRFEFQPYKCSHCGSWHLHSNKPPCANKQAVAA